MAVFVANVPINPPALTVKYRNADAEVVQVGKDLRVDVTGPAATVNLIGNPQNPLVLLFGLPLGTAIGANLVINGQVQFTVSGSLKVTELAPYLAPGYIDIAGAIAYVLKDNDSVTGANVSGVDLLGGYSGNDVIQGRAGKDVIDGGVGTDTATYTEKLVGISLTLGSGGTATIQKTGVTGSLGGNAAGGVNEDTVKNVENVIGGRGNDFLTGNAASNKLIGGVGNDTLKGNAGNDTVLGDAGNDWLDGGAGNDTLNGGLGNDRLIGGLGKDTQTGGAGNDFFRFDAVAHSVTGVNADVISDFDKLGNDIIDLSAFAGTLSYKGLGALTGLNQVRINDIDGPDLLVEINVVGSLAADMQIRLKATAAASMTATDFDLV